jgi:hypothetical protein
MQKLADVDTRLRRWETRMTRATNMVAKLSKQRRRLAVQLGRPDRTPPFVQAADLNEAERSADGHNPGPAISVDDPDLESKVAAALDIPTFLRRGQDAQKAVDAIIDTHAMKVEREKKIDKSAMPLTGKAALAAIKPKRKARA